MSWFRQFMSTLAMMVAFGIANAYGATIYVDAANPAPPGDGSAGNPFTTITNAVVALAASNAVSQGGHVISVAPGAYTAEVVFTNDHSGGTSPNTLLAPSGGVTNSGQAITLINASNLVVSGFVVTKAPSAGILLTGTDPGESDNVTITNCVVSECGAHGIRLGQHRLTGCLVTHTMLHNNGNNGLRIDGQFTYATLDHCLIAFNKGSGTRHEQVQGYITVRNSIIVGNGQSGCYEQHNQGDTIAVNCCFYANGVVNHFDFEHAGGNVLRYCDTAEQMAATPGWSGNIVANPGFSDLAGNWNFNQFYSDSPVFGAGEDGSNIGPFANPPTVTPTNETFHVNAATGDDSRMPGDAQNAATPWKTIGRAAAVAAAGDTVVVAGGTYNEQVVITKGGSRNPVRYRADGAVELNGGGAANSRGFFLDRVADVVIEGFNVRQYRDGVFLSCALSNVVTDCELQYNANSGLYLSRAHRSLVERSDIHHNTAYGVFFEDGGSSDRGSGGTVLNRCRIYGGHSYAVYVYRGQLPRLMANCDIYGNTRGLYAYQSQVILYPYGGGYDRYTFIENCVFHGQTEYGLSIGLLYHRARISNSIFADNGTYGIVEHNAQGDASTMHNCFVNNTLGDYYSLDPTVGAITGAAEINARTEADGTTWGFLSSGNIDGDPGFVNAAAGDFRLRSGSRCIDAGTNTVEIAEDLYGTPRPIGRIFDIGSFERERDRGTVLLVR